MAASRVELQFEGMTCTSCVARAEKALLKVPGVSSASVNLATEKASVETLGDVSFATLAAAIDKAGGVAKPVADAVAPAPPAGYRSGGRCWSLRS